MRYPMHIDTWWAPLLLVGGATQHNSFVDLTDDEVIMHFGLIFRDKVPRGDIEGVKIRAWPLWYGVGWRGLPPGTVGLIGSYQGVVEITLRKRRRAWGVLPYSRICVSLENPDAFIDAVTGREKPASAEASARRAGTRHRGAPRRSRGRSAE